MGFNFSRIIASLVLLLFALTTVFLTAVGVARATSQPSIVPPAYLQAVKDAKNPKSREIWRKLTNIVGYNSKLTWEGEPGQSRVLIAIWTSWSGYEESLGQPMELTQDVWVTAVPDLRNFCQAYHPTDKVTLPYRLNQVLGLPPDSPGKTRKVVEAWVNPNDIFRPSPDPEITDREAELNFRSNALTTVPKVYQDWFNTEFANRYPEKPVNEEGQIVAYPWTQLGYTYDWGNPSDWKGIKPPRFSDVGLSEFVIVRSSTIKVDSVKTVEDYC